MSALRRRWVGCPPVVTPLLILIAGTLLLCIDGCEMRIMQLLFEAGGAGWPSRYAQPWRAMYFLAVVPALVLTVGAAAVLIGSLWITRLRCWRRAGWFVLLSLALGPGLIVNGLLKPLWGRPRPAHVAELGGAGHPEFGGDVQYAPVWSPGATPGAMSFPSGHASMGFFLMVPAFLLYRKHRLLAALLFALGVFFGSTAGVVRMIQGRHFPSDVLWSAACVYYSALFVYLLLHLDRSDTLDPECAHRHRTCQSKVVESS